MIEDFGDVEPADFVGGADAAPDYLNQDLLGSQVVTKTLDGYEVREGGILVKKLIETLTGYNVYEDGRIVDTISKTAGGVITSGLLGAEQTAGMEAGTAGEWIASVVAGDAGLASSLDTISDGVASDRYAYDISNDLTDVVGTPVEDAAYWQQQTTGFTCAVQAQRGIIEAFTGKDVSEAQLTYDATVNGWLTDGGMSPLDVGNLLELYDIPCHTVHDASIGDLVSELAQGRKVIVGVDSGEMWHNEFLEDFFKQSADHATWVTGMDFTDPENPLVTVNDSGEPDGAGKVYALTDFEDAWADSGFFYMATDAAPGGWWGAGEEDLLSKLADRLPADDSGLASGFEHASTTSAVTNRLWDLDDAAADAVFRQL